MVNATNSNAIISKSKNIFSNFFLPFWNLDKIWNTLKKKMSLGGYFFPKLYTGKSGVTYMSIKPRVRTLMDSQYVNGSETLHKSARQSFCHFFWLLLKKTSSKKSFLVVSEILRHFVKILTPDDKYSLSVKASV